MSVWTELVEGPIPTGVRLRQAQPERALSWRSEGLRYLSPNGGRTESPRSKGVQIDSARVPERREEVAAAAGHHEQMPHEVRVANLRIEQKDHRTRGVGDAAGH